MNNQLTETNEARASATEPRSQRGKSAGRRGIFLKWLRRIHGWIGLWGAVLGLLFGVTGFLQNHRATMKIRVGDAPVVSKIHLQVPDPAPQSPREMANWLRSELKLDRPAERANREPAHAVTWGDRSVMQPERWQIRFIAPSYLLSAEYWKGGNTIDVERRDQGIINTLEGLHRAEGARAGWILLADSMAGSLVLLSLTGVVLWTGLNRRRTSGAAIFLIALGAGVVLALQSL